MIMSITVAVAIFSYQITALDIVINNICMMLSFGKLENQFNRLCGCCIKLQHYCCSKKRSKTEHNLAGIQNDHHNMKTPAQNKEFLDPQITSNHSEIP